MWLHYTYATAARDGVIAGRLEQVQAPLRALADARPSAELPLDWEPWLQDMRSIASQGSGASTLQAAAKSVAKLASACGDCHRTTGGGYGDPKRQAGIYDPGDQKGLAEKMARHWFSADALWQGLTGPEHQAWTAGASALMNIRVPGLVDVHGTPATEDRRPSGEGALQGRADPRLPPQDEAGVELARARGVDLDAALRQLRELGTRADQARTAEEKRAVFADLLGRCGHCHAALGVRVSSIATRASAPSSGAAPRRVSVTADKIVITEKIQFDFDAATIRPESHSLLDEIASVVRSNPQLRRISIEGHTDSDGEAAYNLTLSRDRAAAVLNDLLARGVEADRLTSAGFGEERPIASNETAAGKEENRRVEFLITEQTTITRTHEIDPHTGRTHEVQ